MNRRAAGVIGISLAALLLPCTLAFADPIDIGPNAPPQGLIQLDNASQYTRFALLLGSVPYVSPYGWPTYGGPMVFSAVERPVYDSARAVVDADTVYFRANIMSFLRTDSRVRSVTCAPASLPRRSIKILGGRCTVIEDVYHIVTLDSVRLMVAPVRAVYRFSDDSVLAMSYYGQTVRPTPMLLDLGYVTKSQFYAVFSAVSLAAFAATVFRSRRRRNPYR